MWELGWNDDNGFNDYYYEDGEPTACNPTGQINDEYQLCKNNGTILSPDWECDAVTPSTVNPPMPTMRVDGCGYIYWESYAETDTGQGGTDLGNCPVTGCTTTDSFSHYGNGEYGGDVQGWCEDDVDERGAPPPRTPYSAVIEAVVAGLPIY